VRFSPDGKLLLIPGSYTGSGQFNRTYLFVDVSSGRLLRAVGLPGFGGMEFSPEGNLLIASVLSGRIRVDSWSLPTRVRIPFTTPASPAAAPAEPGLLAAYEGQAVNLLEFLQTNLGSYRSGGTFPHSFQDLANVLMPHVGEFREGVHGYRYTYTSGPADAQGNIASYVISAQPLIYQQTGLRSFRLDQTGQVHATEDDREATTSDAVFRSLQDLTRVVPSTQSAAQAVPTTPTIVASSPSSIASSSSTAAGIERPSPKSREVRMNPKDGLDYVWVPPGTFLMGCSAGDSECSETEKPSHNVSITTGFWMGRTEVTVGAYQRYAAMTGRQLPSAPTFNASWENKNMPIVSVSWDDAGAYCQWAEGRLPTEAEWEFAARGGDSGARYRLLDEVAWYGDNSGRQGHPVGQKLPNTFGVYDSLGNVWEWVNDRYDQNYYSKSPPSNPPGPATGDYRVLRGGSWDDNAWSVRASVRLSEPPGYRDKLFGIRCARNAPVAP